MVGNDTENRILDAALDVLSERSISGTRIHLVTEKVGLVPSNLHYYFKTKDDLLLALLERILQRYLEARTEVMDRESADLSGALHAFFEQKKFIIKEDSRMDFIEMDFWVHSNHDERIKKQLKLSYDSWRNHIVQVLELYMPQLTEKQKKYISYTMVSLMMGASMQYLIDDSFDLDEYFAMGLRLILKATRDEEL